MVAQTTIKRHNIKNNYKNRPLNKHQKLRKTKSNLKYRLANTFEFRKQAKFWKKWLLKWISTVLLTPKYQVSKEEENSITLSQSPKEFSCPITKIVLTIFSIWYCNDLIWCVTSRCVFFLACLYMLLLLLLFFCCCFFSSLYKKLDKNSRN